MPHPGLDRFGGVVAGPAEPVGEEYVGDLLPVSGGARPGSGAERGQQPGVRDGAGQHAWACPPDWPVLNSIQTILPLGLQSSTPRPSASTEMIRRPRPAMSVSAAFPILGSRRWWGSVVHFQAYEVLVGVQLH